VLSAVAAIVLMVPVILLGTVMLGVLYRYVIYPLTDIEYEYLYCDRQLTVSKIMAKEKRKDLETFELEKVELLTPANSYRLADVNNRELKVTDYWSLSTAEGHVPYAMIYEGNRKILLDLPTDFVKIIQNNAPRKVFTD
ncbi:MAG: hypothetical protein IKI75_02795, partial [Lachnospiraceae bacterium]|nr:hypothetical protein [Lachnospiraceae bacterium]